MSFLTCTDRKCLMIFKVRNLGMCKILCNSVFHPKLAHSLKFLVRFQVRELNIFLVFIFINIEVDNDYNIYCYR